MRWVKCSQQLFIADLQASQAEFSTDLMVAIAEQLVELQAARSDLESFERGLGVQGRTLEIYELGYRVGQGSTTEYFSLQSGITQTQQDLCAAVNEEQLARLELVAMVQPRSLDAVEFSGCDRDFGELSW